MLRDHAPDKSSTQSDVEFPQAPEEVAGLDAPAGGIEVDTKRLSQLTRELAKSLKRISGRLLRNEIDQVPEEVMRASASYEALKEARGDVSEEVFRHVESLLETKDWTTILQLQVGKIVAVSKALKEL